MIYCGVVGEVLGSQVEGYTHESIARRYPSGVQEYGARSRPTDDSAMTEVLLNYMLMHPGQKIVDQILMADYAASAAEDPYGYSMSTRQLLALYATNVLCQERLNKDTNGCVMRISPLALLSWNTDDELKREIDAVIGRTHDNDQSRLVSFCHVKLLQALMKGKSKDECFCMIERFASSDKEFSQKLSLMDRLRKSVLSEDSDQHTTNQTTRRNTQKFNFSLEMLGNPYFQIRAVDCFCVALYHFLIHEDPRQALIDCVGEGGDTDTTAKVLGEMLGAHYGMSWVPKLWEHPFAYKLACMAHAIVSESEIALTTR